MVVRCSLNPAKRCMRASYCNMMLTAAIAVNHFIYLL